MDVCRLTWLIGTNGGGLSSQYGEIEEVTFAVRRRHSSRLPFVLCGRLCTFVTQQARMLPHYGGSMYGELQHRGRTRRGSSWFASTRSPLPPGVRCQRRVSATEHGKESALRCERRFGRCCSSVNSSRQLKLPNSSSVADRMKYSQGVYPRVTLNAGALYAATSESPSDEMASCPALHLPPTMCPLSATSIDIFQTLQVGLIIPSYLYYCSTLPHNHPSCLRKSHRQSEAHLFVYPIPTLRTKSKKYP